MGEAAKRILDELMALSDDERELVAVELNARMHAHDPGWEAAWSDEIERRIEEVRTGAVELVSWDELRAARQARRSR
jgi:putative addiction module component (TIGR02574 family)